MTFALGNPRDINFWNLGDYVGRNFTSFLFSKHSFLSLLEAGYWAELNFVLPSVVILKSFSYS